VLKEPPISPPLSNSNAKLSSSYTRVRPDLGALDPRYFAIRHGGPVTVEVLGRGTR
jgi:hypothetical protein